MTNIESHSSFTGDNVGGPGPGVYLADRGHQPWNLERLMLHARDPLCGSRNRIMSKMHRSRAGVVGLADE